MNLPPKLTIAVKDLPGYYGLAGWEEFNLWMLRNDAGYRAALDVATRVGMSETDRLRLLLSTQASIAAELRENLDTMFCEGNPPIKTFAQGAPRG